MWWNKFLGLKLERGVADPVKKDLTLYWWHWGYPTWVTGLPEVQLCLWPNPCSALLYQSASLLCKSELRVCSARESTRLGGTRIQCNSATPQMVLLNKCMVWFNLGNVPDHERCNTMRYLSEVWLNRPTQFCEHQLQFIKTLWNGLKKQQTDSQLGNATSAFLKDEK